MVPAYDRRSLRGVRVAAQPKRDFLAMLLLVSMLVVASIFAANISVFGSSGTSDGSIGILKFLRDGTIVLMFLYLLVYYPGEVLKLFYIPALLVLCSVLFRNDYFHVLGVAALARIILVMAAGVLVYKAMDERGEKSLDALILIGFAYALTTFWVVGEQLTQVSRFGATFFGGRVQGFTEDPLILSQSMAAIVILVALKDRWKLVHFALVGTCSILALLSGGRGGMLSIVMTLVTVFFVNRSRVTFVSVAYIIGGLMVMPVVFTFLSSASISGRSGTERQEGFDARVDVWGDLVERFMLEDVSSFLFGYAPGMGANGLFSLAKSGAVQLAFQPVIADSFFMFTLLSFGFVGLAVVLLAIAYFLFKISYFKRVLCLTAISPLLLSLNTFELYPANVFLAAALAVILWKPSAEPVESAASARAPLRRTAFGRL